MKQVDILISKNQVLQILAIPCIIIIIVYIANGTVINSKHTFNNSMVEKLITVCSFERFRRNN